MPQRQFFDSQDREWTVWDVVPSRVSLSEHRAANAPEQSTGATSARARARLPEAFAEGWLAFERPGEKRRLAPLPRGWETLTDRELEMLCDEAAVVLPRGARAPIAPPDLAPGNA